jgi:outer membrane receptor protein involved in Fe transport
MSEDIESRQFYQEIRFNYNSHEKFTAFAGASYWREHIVQDYTFMPNEQHMFHLLFDPSYMITPDGHPVSVPALPMIPQLGPLGGTPLPTKHTELTTAESTNKSVELFIDGTYAITDKLSITGGARLIFDDLSLYNRQEFTGGEQSVLGYLTGSAPNMLFPVRAPSDTSETFRSIVERVILNYKVSNNLILFTSFSKGRRPNVLQSRADNGFEILDSEIVKSLEFGIKGKLNNRIMFDGNLFYQKYSNFQTSAWVSDQELGEFTLIVKDGGRATSYGFESTIRFALAKSLKAYISYAYINARFDDENDKGEPHPYAGNRFRLTPDNSVGIGLNWQQKISSGISFFASPVYSYKSKIYFEDANSEELSQEAIELLNLNIGVKLTNLNTTISAYSKNILDEKYLLSAGNTGSLFKIPTFVPATPRTFGININYQF